MRSRLTSKKPRSAGEGGERGPKSRKGQESDGATVPLVADDKGKELAMMVDGVKAPLFRGAEVRPGSVLGVLGWAIEVLQCRFRATFYL